MSSNLVNHMLTKQQIFIYLNPYKVALWMKKRTKITAFLCVCIPRAESCLSEVAYSTFTAPSSECPWTAVSDGDTFSKEHTHAARQHLL